jgi:hypothetical protein
MQTALDGLESHFTNVCSTCNKPVKIGDLRLDCAIL